MKRKHNTKLIGAFVTAAILLLVGMVLFFGSASLLTKSVRFILFFDQSVNGLAAGSPVKFRGVPVGSVERIIIRAEGQREDSTAIPVIIRLDQSRLEGDLGVTEAEFSSVMIHESIERGLMAQLNLESFITGQLFVEFSFEPEQKGDWQPHLEEASGMFEIPTLGSSLDEITKDAAQVISNLSAIDISRLNQNVNEVLENLAIVLEGIDSDEISSSVAGAADEFKALLSSEDFKQTILSVSRAFEQVGTTAETFDLAKGPLAQTIGRWTAKYEATLTSLQGLINKTGEVVDPSSDLFYEFENTLRELSRAAQSIRMLVDYLERNPNAILTGRPEDEE